jgi:hypothetical protein
MIFCLSAYLFVFPSSCLAHPPLRNRGLKTISNERVIVMTESCNKAIATIGDIMYQMLSLKKSAPWFQPHEIITPQLLLSNGTNPSKINPTCP